MTHARAIVTGEYYHVYNRGLGKRTVFQDRADYARFLFGVLYFQSPTLIAQVGRNARTFSDHGGFEVSETLFSNVQNGKHVELVAFCLMPNHYHLVLRQLTDGAIPRYMQRVDLAYARYANLRHEHTGHLFQSPYRSRLVSDNEYLTHLSAYIHRNPRELKGWKGREHEYPWSSYQDYVTENRWGGLLAQEIILDQFDGTKSSNYSDFVKSSLAKEVITSDEVL